MLRATELKIILREMMYSECLHSGFIRDLKIFLIFLKEKEINKCLCVIYTHARQKMLDRF